MSRLSKYLTEKNTTEGYNNMGSKVTEVSPADLDPANTHAQPENAATLYREKKIQHADEKTKQNVGGESKHAAEESKGHISTRLKPSQPINDWIRLLTKLKQEPHKVSFQHTEAGLLATVQSHTSFSRLLSVDGMLDAMLKTPTDSDELVNFMKQQCEVDADNDLVAPNPKYGTLLKHVRKRLFSNIEQGPRRKNLPTQHLEMLVHHLLENKEFTIDNLEAITIPNGDGETITLNLFDIIQSGVDYSSLNITDNMFDQYLEEIKSRTGKEKTSEILVDLQGRREIFSNLEKLTECMMSDPFPDKKRYRSAFNKLWKKIQAHKPSNNGIKYERAYAVRIQDAFEQRLKSRIPGADFSYKPMTDYEYPSIGIDFMLHRSTTNAYTYLNPFQRGLALGDDQEADRSKMINKGLDSACSATELTSEQHTIERNVACRLLILENTLISAGMTKKVSTYPLRPNDANLKRNEREVITRAKKEDKAGLRPATYQAAAVTCASDEHGRFVRTKHHVKFSAAGACDMSLYSHYTSEGERTFIANQEFTWNDQEKKYHAASSPEFDEKAKTYEEEWGSAHGVNTEEKSDSEKQQELIDSISSFNLDRIRSLSRAYKNMRDDKDLLEKVGSEVKQCLYREKDAKFRRIKSLIERGYSTVGGRKEGINETALTALIKLFKSVREDEDLLSEFSKDIQQCLSMLLDAGESPLDKNHDGVDAFTLLLGDELQPKRAALMSELDNIVEPIQKSLYTLMARKCLTQPKPKPTHTNTYGKALANRMVDELSSYKLITFGKQKPRARTEKISDAASLFAAALLKKMGDVPNTAPSWEQPRMKKHQAKMEDIRDFTQAFISKQADRDSSFWKRTTRHNYTARLKRFKKAMVSLSYPTASKRKQKKAIQRLSAAANNTATHTRESNSDWLDGMYQKRLLLWGAIARANKAQESAASTSEAASPVRSNQDEALINAFTELITEFEQVLTQQYKSRKSDRWLKRYQEEIYDLLCSISPCDGATPPLAPEKSAQKLAKIALWHFKALAKGHITRIPTSLRKALAQFGETHNQPSLLAAASLSEPQVIAFANNLRKQQSKRAAIAVGTGAAVAIAAPIAGKVFLGMKALSVLAGVPFKIKLGADIVAATGIGLGARNLLTGDGKHSLFAFSQTPGNQQSVTTRFSKFLKRTKNLIIKKKLSGAQHLLGIDKNADLTSSRGIDGFFCTKTQDDDSQRQNKSHVEVNKLNKTSTAAPQDWVISATLSQRRKAAQPTQVALTFNRQSDLTKVSVSNSELSAKKLIAYLKAEGKTKINLETDTLEPSYAAAVKKHAEDAGISVVEKRALTPVRQPSADEDKLVTPLLQS